MKTFIASMAIAWAALSASSAVASTYFTNPFDFNPPLSPTQTAGAWYPDRYAPAAFDSMNFGGDNRLHLGISASDGLANRPAAYQSTFYNTQGRSYDLGNGTYTSIKGMVYVGTDWSTNYRRSDMWGVCADNANVVQAYPIIGFANTTSTNLVCRVWDNVNGVWIPVSAAVPGGVTTNRWYTLEIKLKPGVFEYYVDGKLVYSDSKTIGSTKFNSMLIQGYNFNDASLGAGNFPSGLNDSYNIYWDNITASPVNQEAYPVDLNGTYRAASSGALNPSGPSSQSGVGLAATAPLALGVGNVFERNGTNIIVSDNAVNGTFTPFNDVNKVPNGLVLTTANDANGTRYEADVELSGTWKPFQFGQGIGNVPPFATGDTFNVGLISATTSFGIQFVKNTSGQYVARIAAEKLATGSLATLETNGTPATFPAGTTKVRVNGTVMSGVFSGTVMPLDGPAAYSVYVLGSTNGLNMDTISPFALDYNNAAFASGFETFEHVAAAASAKVTNFTTDAVENVLYSFSDDPYVRSADGASSIIYRVGQANLLQNITGYQVFMANSAGQTFVSGAHAGPYNTFIPSVINSSLDFAGADSNENAANLAVANLFFTPAGSEQVVNTTFQPPVGTNVTQFSGGSPFFNDIPAVSSNSNPVLIDNTAPTLTTPVLGGSSWVNPNVVQGSLDITVDATDLGTTRSGLDGRPTGVITWSDGSTTALTTFSVVGNTFRATTPITGTTPNGTATVTMTVVDRAGNTTSQTITFNVSTVNVAVTMNEVGVTSNVTRWVTIKVGATGGTHAPITVNKLVSFNTPVTISGVPSRQGSVLITYQDLDAADGGLANSVDGNAALTRFIAKDPFFSLATQSGIVGTAGNFTGAADLRMGDVTNNNIVNVSDLAVWAANNGTAQSPNTTINQSATPRQANLDGTGIVDLADRNLIVSSWLLAGDNDTVGNFRGGLPDGSQTVEEVAKETGLPIKVVMSMDTNRDGIITKAEVLSWRPNSGR